MPTPYDIIVPTYCKDFFPKSIAEGWGEQVINTVFTYSAHLSSIGNCGLSVLQNCGISSSVRNNPKLPASVADNYALWMFTPENDWRGALEQHLKQWEKDNEKALIRGWAAWMKTQGKYGMFILSDCVNRHSKWRRGVASPEKINSTSWIGRMLVKHKIGYVVQSPVCINETHTTRQDFSLIRAWVWLPDWSRSFKPDKFLGYGTIKTKSQVAENLAAQWNLTGTNLSKTVEEALDSYKFPE